MLSPSSRANRVSPASFNLIELNFGRLRARQTRRLGKLPILEKEKARNSPRLGSSFTAVPALRISGQNVQKLAEEDAQRLSHARRTKSGNSKDFGKRKAIRQFFPIHPMTSSTLERHLEISTFSGAVGQRKGRANLRTLRGNRMTV
jgi:hypothetical protein